MTDLRAIRGKKPKAMAQARILECVCGSRSVTEYRVGVTVDKRNRVIHRGTLVRECKKCGKEIG